MATKPTPRKKPVALPPVDRTVVDPIASGLGVVRKKLFSMPTISDGWHTVMVMQIEGAKALGFSMFEIDTADAMVPKPKVDRSDYSFASYLLRLEPEDGDGAWKKAGENGELIKATVVTVYALVVE